MRETRSHDEMINEVRHVRHVRHVTPQTPGHPPFPKEATMRKSAALRAARHCVAAALAACQSTPDAPGARAAARPRHRRHSSTGRALVDRVRRSRADRAGGRGAREQSRPAGRDGPHRPCPCQRAVRIFEPVPECRPRRRRRRAAEQPRRVDSRCPPGTPSSATTTRPAFERRYEVDLWGRFRNGDDAARSELLATGTPRDGAHDRGRRHGPRVLRAARRRRACSRLLEDTLKSREDTVRAAERPLRRRHNR